MSTDTLTPTTKDTCTATWHNTAAAYRKAGCRCPRARAAETARKRRYDNGRDRSNEDRNLWQAVINGVPPFHTDPSRNCATLTNPDVMFPERAADVPDALAICAGCPFKQACATWALNTNQIYGVWGGTTGIQRRRTIAARLKGIGA